jgi:DNA-binding transcriptional LysR family regulator
LVAGSRGELAGVVRVAGYSSVVRSVLMPALAPLLRAHPKVQVHFVTREMRELQSLLARGEAEFVVLDRELARAGIESRKLGDETYALVESSKHRARDSVYLDHDPDDPVTREFLKKSEAPAPQRSFLGDIYGVLDGVRDGLGRAFAPQHLIAGVSGLRPVKGSRTEKIPVVLHFHAQPVYPRLQKAVLETFVSSCKALLEK